MLINCVLYQNGERVGDIPVSDIRKNFGALKSCGTATKVWTDCQALAAPAKFKQSRWGSKGPFPNTGSRVPNRA